MGDYTAGTYKHNGVSVPYQIHLPVGYEEGKEYPLMLFLHGRGFIGTDNEKVIASSEYVLCRKMIEENRQCIILAPQSPAYWVTHSQQNKPYPRTMLDYEGVKETDHLKTVRAMVEELKASGLVDASRIYLSGYSMGSQAGWYLLATYPNDYAAAILSCGVGSIEKADVIAKTPVYVFHGDKDDTVDFESGRLLTEAVKNAGGDAVFIRAEGYGHGISVPMRNDKEVIDWLFSKSKEQPEQ